MSSDNSDSNDSLSDFQCINNIKKEDISPSRRSSVSSTSSSEQLLPSIRKSPAKSVSTSSTSSPKELSPAIPKSSSADESTSVTASSQQLKTSISKPSPKKLLTNNTSSLPLNLQHYISKYESQFIPLAGAAKALDEIESDEEVCLVQASKDFNLKEFVNKKLNTKKKNQLETNDGISLEYYVENFTKKPNLTLIYGDKGNSAMKVNTFNPVGKIIIREKLVTCETATLDDPKIELPKKVLFPRDLKIRHPLLGAFYTDKINLSEKILKQLQSSRNIKRIKTEPLTKKIIKMEQSDNVESAEETPVKKHKKSKKLKREHSVELDEIERDELDNAELSEIVRSPKKNKIKLEIFDDENDLSWLTQL